MMLIFFSQSSSLLYLYQNKDPYSGAMNGKVSPYYERQSTETDLNAKMWSLFDRCSCHREVFPAIV